MIRRAKKTPIQPNTASPSPSTTTPPEDLLRRLAGRQQRARKLVALFLEEDGPEQLDLLRKAQGSGDLTTVGAAAKAAGAEITAYCRFQLGEETEG